MKIASWCDCCGSEKLKSSQAILAPYVAFKALGIAPTAVTPEWGLRDIPCGTYYMPCHTLVCQECGYTFLEFRFEDEEMAKLYEGYRKEENTKLRQTFEPNYVLHKPLSFLDEVEKFLHPFLPQNPAILDWGGDDGSNAVLKYKCSKYHIYDIGTNKPVFGQRIEYDEAIKENYDLVVCSNVLEHLASPSKTLLWIKPLLGRDTVVYVEVPYENVIRDGGVKRLWHEHINLFTEKSLEALFGNANLTILDKKILDVSPGSSAKGVMMYACRRKE